MVYTRTILTNIRRWRRFYPYSSVSRRLVDLYNDTIELHDRIKAMTKTQIKMQEPSLRRELRDFRTRWRGIEGTLNAIFWLNYANLDEIDYKRIKVQLTAYPVYEGWELASVLTQIDLIFDEIELLIVVIEILKLTIVVNGQDFHFYLKEDWDYKVYYDFPDYWVGRGGVPDRANIQYGVKYKCMMLVAMTHGKHINMFGNRWKNYTVDELRLMEASGLPLPSYPRRLIYDPDNMITVSGTVAGGRREGKVDFSGFSHMLSLKLDLKSIDMQLSGYRYKTTYVSKVGD